MSFDKRYANRKDWRADYRGPKRFYRSCRNHGSCPWCERDRTISRKRVREATRLAEQELRC